MRYLFDSYGDWISSDGIVKNYFNLMYHDNHFLEAIDNITNKQSYFLDGIYCFFPDMESVEQEEHFEGVQFGLGYPLDESELISVSEEVCFHYLKLACEKYLNKHLKDKNIINVYLDRIGPLADQ